jgi:mono/diheme cytochrome c family protein
MRVMLKLASLLVGCLVVLAGGGVSYFLLAYPTVGPAPDIRVAQTPDAVARGRYLADHVAVCTDCHSQRDWTRFGGPIKPGTYAAGGEVFDESMGLPGRIVSRNLTPGALGTWSDGEILRAITAGVAKDGSALFPLMPYRDYGSHMDPDDARAIVSYLRTIPASSHVPERTRLNFPLPLIVRTLPQEPAAATRRPPVEDRVAYGQYLTRMAGCTHCHTPMTDKMAPVEGRMLSGGTEFAFPGGVVARAANLTPHATGLGAWSETDFVQRFKSAATEPRPVGAGEFNTPMPWRSYAGMTEADLGAIYAYLRSVPAVNHAVEKMGRASRTN